MERFLPIIQFVSLVAGIVFFILGMHYRAHDKKTAESEAYTNDNDTVSYKALTPTGVQSICHLRGLRYHFIGVVLFFLGVIPAVWRML